MEAEKKITSSGGIFKRLFRRKNQKNENQLS
jgi:hypothetical protein